MKKKKFILLTLLIFTTFAFFKTEKVEAAIGTWIGDYCENCGSYGSAGICDQVKSTTVGLFRVSFYLNGRKLGNSVNVSSSVFYQQLAANATWHWGDGKTDIVSYANGTGLGTPNKGGLDTTMIIGLTTSNVQTMLSPSKNSSNVQKILNAAGITEFIFKDGKIYYYPPNGECEGDYQIQMIVEAMQVINWLCITDESGTIVDNHRWIGTPYELNNGLLDLGYNSKAGGNGYKTGSIVDKQLLSALRLNETVTVGEVSFSAVDDCLSIHIRGYDAHQGYGFNIYNLTGDFEIECDEPTPECCDPNTDPEHCCFTTNNILYGEVCIPPDEYWSKPENQDYYHEYCELPEPPTEEICPPITLTGEAYCDTADCDGENNKSIFEDPVFNTTNSSINNLIDNNGKINLSNLSEDTLRSLATEYADNTFLAVAKSGETYKEPIAYNGGTNKYCDLYCQEIAIITLPDFYPAANAGRYFMWYINDGEESKDLIRQEVTRICAEDIKLDDFIEDYYRWMNSRQNTVDGYANYTLSCNGFEGVVSVTEGVDGAFHADQICDYELGCCMRTLPICPTTCPENQNYGGSTCQAEIARCNQEREEKIKSCQNGYSICMNGDLTNLPRREVIENWRLDLIENPVSFENNFTELLSCFDEQLGTEIETDLNFYLEMGELGQYFSDSFEKYETEVSASGNSLAICVDGKDCDDSYFSYKPQIEDYKTKTITTMNCSTNDWASTDLKESPVTATCELVPNSSGPVYNTYSEWCEDAKKSCYVREFGTPGGNSYSDVCDTDYYAYRAQCSNARFKCDNLWNDVCDAMSAIDIPYPNGKYVCSSSSYKVRTTSVPNFIEGTGILPNELPMMVGDFTVNGGSYNGWRVSKTIQDILNEKGIPDFDWWKTFRLVAQSKTESYSLNDGINACVCSDGTIGDLISKDDFLAKNPGATVNGDSICDCAPEEIITSEFSENSSGVGNVQYETNERWGICTYSAYNTIKEGGNYSLKYMVGSGSYPLNIYYWNIGSIDLDGNAHFSDILDNCGCTGGMCEYTGDECKLLIGNAIMNDNWSYERTDWWNLSSSYYVCRGDECGEPECPPGECPNPPDVPTGPDPVCPNGECIEGLSLVYRSIDLDEPFPDRTSGDNWYGKNDRITENRGVDGKSLYSSDLQPLYRFKLTPSLIKEIRTFNNAYGHDYATSSTIAYPNDQLEYADNPNYTGYTVGISQVLRNELVGYFANAASANGNDLDEWFVVPAGTNTCDDYIDEMDNPNGVYDYCVKIDDTYYNVTGDPACWDLARTYLGGGSR